MNSESSLRFAGQGRMHASASRLPSPEEVFAEWLLSVPAQADLVAAAREQIARIDSRATRHPDVRCLRALLHAVVRDGAWQQPINYL